MPEQLSYASSLRSLLVSTALTLSGCVTSGNCTDDNGGSVNSYELDDTMGVCGDILYDPKLVPQKELQTTRMADAGIAGERATAAARMNFCVERGVGYPVDCELVSLYETFFGIGEGQYSSVDTATTVPVQWSCKPENPQ